MMRKMSPFGAVTGNDGCTRTTRISPASSWPMAWIVWPALCQAAVVAWLGGWQNSGGLLLACGAIGVGLALALRTAELRLAQSRLRSA